jgi:hypothetical protein
MKAHVVKGNVFPVVFLLAARFREAVAGAAGWAIVFFVSPSCGPQANQANSSTLTPDGAFPAGPNGAPSNGT